MKSKKNLRQLVVDNNQLKLNYLKMMIDFITKENSKICEDDKEDLLLLYLFLESM